MPPRRFRSFALLACVVLQINAAAASLAEGRRDEYASQALPPCLRASPLHPELDASPSYEALVRSVVPACWTGRRGGPFVFGFVMPLLQELFRCVPGYLGPVEMVASLVLFPWVDAGMHVFSDYKEGLLGGKRWRGLSLFRSRWPGRFWRSYGFSLAAVVVMVAAHYSALKPTPADAYIGAVLAHVGHNLVLARDETGSTMLGAYFSRRMESEERKFKYSLAARAS